METAASLGMTPTEYTAYLNQRNRQNKSGRQKGFRGSYNSKYSDL